LSELPENSRQIALEAQKMKYSGANQVVFDLDFNATHTAVGPFRVIVSGFSRYHSTVQSLAILEKIRLVIAADFIAESFRPGNLPVTSVRIIGHADFDAQRGRDFEHSISLTRALDVERELRARVDRLTWEFNPTVTPLRNTGPLSSTIDWKSTGAGATEPAPENVKRHRTPANMTEADRKLNRRVEIFLEPGTTPVPTPPSPEAVKVIEDILRGRRVIPFPPPPPPGRPEIPWVLPKREDRKTFLDMVKALNDTLGFLDADTILGTIKDHIPPGDPNWTVDFLSEWQKLEDERRLRNDVPPRRGVDPLGGDK
jgi:hypothetical protein